MRQAWSVSTLFSQVFSLPSYWCLDSPEHSTHHVSYRLWLTKRVLRLRPIHSPVRPLWGGLEDSEVQSPLSKQVQWDGYSLILRGQRVFLHSGEFHTFRLPVPALWTDILQKAQAAGLNAISVYTHWGLINPSPGVIDLDGFRSLRLLFEAAKAAGVWIVLRPGNVLCHCC